MTALYESQFDWSMTDEEYELAQTDVICLVNNYLLQVIVVDKKEFEDPTFSLFKIRTIFFIDAHNVFVEEHRKSNIENQFKNFNIHYY